MSAQRRLRASVTALVVTAAVVIFGCSRTGLRDEQGDFWIETIEATQGVQLFQLVPLIFHKPTFVRVSVRGTADYRDVLPTVRATLTVDTFDGRTETLRPSNTDTLTVPASDGRAGDTVTRWSLANSFLFELPDAATAGTRLVHVSLERTDGPAPPRSAGRERERDVHLTYHYMITPTLGFLRYQYHNVPPELVARQGLSGPIWPANDTAAMDRMMPLVSNLWSRRPQNYAFISDEVGDFNCRYDAASGQCLGYLDAQAWAAGIVDAGPWPPGRPGFPSWVVVIRPEREPAAHIGTYVTTPRGNHVITVAEDLTDTGLALAHELGHSFGLCDIGTPGCAYPRPGGALGPYTGLRYIPSLSVVQGENPAGVRAATDLMALGGAGAGPVWISPRTFCQGLAYLLSVYPEVPGEPLPTGETRLVTCPATLDSS
jgi:hypothetical protein